MAHVHLINSAICRIVKGMLEMLADQSGDKRVMHFFPAEAVYLLQSAVKGNGSMIQFSLGEPFN
ncbi:hypothetical protein D3C76_1491760 [compost metagenome]